MQEVSEVRHGLHHFHWPELGLDSIDYLTANGSFFGANEENETSCLHCLIFKASTQIPRQPKSHSLFWPPNSVFFLSTPEGLLMLCLDHLFFFSSLHPLSEPHFPHFLYWDDPTLWCYSEDHHDK